MTTTAITKPELPEKMVQENEGMARMILQFTVTDADSYVQADDLGRKIKGRIKKIDEMCEPFISATKRAKAAAEEARKEAVLFRDRAVEGLETCEAHLNKQVSAYRREQQRIQQEEQARRDAIERERVLKARAEEAAAARAKGRETLAKVIEAAPVETKAAPVANVDLPKTGSSLRQYWKFRVTDADLVPREWCCPDEKLIGEFVRSNKEKTVGVIPGIEVYEDSKTTW